MLSACHPCLFRPGSLRRPLTPLNNPPMHTLLSSAFLHFHLSFVRLPSSFSPSSSNFMPFPHNSHDNTGAASSAPSDRGSSSRSVRPLSSRNLNRILGGSQSRSSAPPVVKEPEAPLGTLGALTARAPLLEGAHFAVWARRSRCNLRYVMLEVLNDDAWDVWHVS